MMTFKSRRIPRLALVALVFVAVSCGGDRVKGPPGALRDPLRANAYPRIAVLEGLQRWLYFSDPIVTPSTADKPMRVTVPMRLVYDAPREIQFRFEYFGADSRPLRSGGWRFRHLEPRTQIYLDGNALETQAADWRLEVRPAR